MQTEAQPSKKSLHHPPRSKETINKSKENMVAKSNPARCRKDWQSSAIFYRS